MNKPAILSLCTAITTLTLSGCGNATALRGIHTVSVGEHISKPKKMSYTDRGTENVAMLGAVTGIVPMLIAGGVSSAMASRSAKALENEAQANAIVIEKIVSGVFAGEIQRSGIFSLVPVGKSDASFQLTIRQYGLIHTGDSWFSSAMAPLVEVEADLVTNDGKSVFNSRRMGFPPKGQRHRYDDYRDHPELLRAGWEEAAGAAAGAVMKDLRKGLED